MARVDNLTNFLTDVASAIKTKKGSQTPIQASEFDTEITNLPSGGGSRDWSEIGYSAEPSVIEDGFQYAKQIQNSWVSETSYSWKFGNDSQLIYMPLVDTSRGTAFNSMFHNCYSLVKIPQLDTSRGTAFNSMFGYCYSLTTIPQLNTSSGTNFAGMFQYCKSLTTIPQLDTSRGTAFNSMFGYCDNLTTIPQLNTSSGTNFAGMFPYCKSLTTIPQLDTSNATQIDYMFEGCNNLTTLGGFKDLGKAYLTTQSANNSRYTLTLSVSTKITHDSLMNVINNLYDIATKGCKTQRLTIGSTNLAKLTSSEIAIATAKGWTVS